MMLSRYQVGRDGRTAYRRTVGKECVQKVVEFGEQVHVKPKRRPQTNRKQSLDSKWKIGTWVGMTSRSNEHIVIIPDGGLGFAIRARTVRRMSVDQRWNSDAIEHINATVKTPVPKIKEITEPAAGETSVVYADVEGDGTQIPEDDHISEDKTVRDFKITRQVLQKYGYSDHCVGCDAALYGKKRGHTTMCRKRLEEAMKADEVDQQRIRRRNERMTGKSHRIDQNNGDDVQMKDEKLDQAKKETGEENQSEEIGSKPCVAPGAIQSDESCILEYCPNEDDKAAREESEHEDAVCTQKRESEEADISEAPAKKRRVALINSRKLIYKVISRVKLRKFDENLIEKTEMIVNRKSCDFTNIECHLKTDVTKVIHAIMEMEEHSPHESEESEQQRWQKFVWRHDFRGRCSWGQAAQERQGH